MNFFSFGRKIKPEAKEGYVLEPIPLFSSLSPEERTLIEQSSRLVGFKRGDIVYAEGVAADAFYIIISGRFRLFTRYRGAQKETTLLYFYRGEHFGETSLLTGNVHSASVEAKTDAVALKISAEDFHKLLKQIPALALQLSRSLGRHLTRDELGYSQHRREVRVGAFYYTSASDGMSRFLSDFLIALKMETHGKVLLMDLSGMLRMRLSEEFRRGSVPGFDLKLMDPASESDIHSSILASKTNFDYLYFAPGQASDEEKRGADLPDSQVERLAVLGRQARAHAGSPGCPDAKGVRVVERPQAYKQVIGGTHVPLDFGVDRSAHSIPPVSR